MDVNLFFFQTRWWTILNYLHICMHDVCLMCVCVVCTSTTKCFCLPKLLAPCLLTVAPDETYHQSKSEGSDVSPAEDLLTEDRDGRRLRFSCWLFSKRCNVFFRQFNQYGDECFFDMSRVRNAAFKPAKWFVLLIRVICTLFLRDQAYSLWRGRATEEMAEDSGSK